ncbi:hypothetical protein GYA93_15825 [Gordonia desulfuricans]|uniref:Uncharacterized protein n=1 Tax=Gordonia desulfuricans TaxID=89051 RepID=A0A7K3LSP9_9ACTN|nr:hypothetical protein [Gordonia desulfuricans]NDK91041.1 hypothetical protein [Gordonia desulfuricans]
MTAVIVTAPVVLVTYDDGLVQYQYQSVVPVEVPEAEAARLAHLGLVTVTDVDDDEPISEDVPASVNPQATGSPERPPRSGSKEAWVEYAVSHGIDRQLAEDSTKADLIAEFD